MQNNSAIVGVLFESEALPLFVNGHRSDSAVLFPMRMLIPHGVSDVIPGQYLCGAASLHLEIVRNLRGSDKPKAPNSSQSFNLDHRRYSFDFP